MLAGWAERFGFAEIRIVHEHNRGLPDVRKTDLYALWQEACALCLGTANTDLDYLHDLGGLSLNISGCMNACGHHHIGNIGILGVDKNGSECYQPTLGGSQGRDAALGRVIERIVQTHVDSLRARRAFSTPAGALVWSRSGSRSTPGGGAGMNNLIKLVEGRARIVADDPRALWRCGAVLPGRAVDPSVVGLVRTARQRRCRTASPSRASLSWRPCR